jgi:hypothetical protein
VTGCVRELTGASQVLPEEFEDIAHAKAFRDVEKAERGGNGSMLQGGGLDVPLAVLSQQRLHVVKYFLKVPEPTAPDGHTVRCAQETLIDAAEARAAERFWPSPVDPAQPDVLYPKGTKQVAAAALLRVANNVCRSRFVTLPTGYGTF